MKKKKFVIIDGNAIIHRAYHALPPLTTKDGTIVNAVYGFVSMLLKVIKDINPDYLSVSFDVSGKTFRDELYTEYKANRVKADQELYDQIPLVHQVVNAFGIPIYTKEGYEADDVIGTVVKKNSKEHKEVENIIVTGDMDTLQLVDKNIKVYALRKGMSDIVLYDQEQIKERYGFGSGNIIDYKALRGDPSDNIPGVEGVGEKTATELITKIGSIEKIYKKLKEKKLEDLGISQSIISKLIAGEKSARMSLKLATIVQNVPGLQFKLDDCKMKDMDSKVAGELFRKFEFYSLLKRIESKEELIKKTDEKKTKLTIVDKKNKKGFFENLQKTNEFICQAILSGPDALNSDVRDFLFIIGHNAFFLDHVTAKNGADKLFFDPKKTLIGHDLKKLIKAAKINGIEVKNSLFDVMIASYLLNSSTRSHDLRNIVIRELGKDISAAGSEQGSLFGSDLQSQADELQMITEIYTEQKKKLVVQDDLGLFEKVEMRLIPVLAEMELNGIAIDCDLLESLSKKVSQSILSVSKRIWHLAGKKFNIASSIQLRDVLYGDLGLPTYGIKKGKTGYSTADPELEKLIDSHPIIESIKEFRELAKLQNTYVDVLPSLVDKKTSRLHTTFNQAVTTTGRLSSSEPNLQNIPIRTELGREIRNAFVSEKGYDLICADYSQIELRTVASLAQDKRMLEIFEKGEDIHNATAAVINNVTLDQVTKEMRSAAKAVNFGVLYGMGAYGLSSRTKISQQEAREFIEKYFQKFSGVRKYLDQTLKLAKRDGYVETLFGRRRYIPELKSSNFQIRAAGERMAINMPIQGTAADLMKMAMIEIRCQFEKLKLTPPTVKLILQVHDELVFEVKHGYENKVAKIVKSVMENAAHLRVPIVADVHIGKRWGEMK